jgi:hypothetical protein
MPQFDISSFNVQLFWLFFSFLTFYFIFSWKYLPSSAFLLKTRKKALSLKPFQNLSFENYKVSYSTKTFSQQNNFGKPGLFYNV